MCFTVKYSCQKGLSGISPVPYSRSHGVGHTESGEQDSPKNALELPKRNTISDLKLPHAMLKWLPQHPFGSPLNFEETWRSHQVSPQVAQFVFLDLGPQEEHPLSVATPDLSAVRLGFVPENPFCPGTIPAEGAKAR